MSSLLKVSPGISDRFLSQKMAQNEPEKKMPSTAAKATRRSWKLLSRFIHFMAHCALSRITSMLPMAPKRKLFSLGSLMQVSIRSEQVSEWTFSMAIWKPQKQRASGICTSEQNCWARFSRTIPSEAAKKARTYLMKCFSLGVSLLQSQTSWARSISSAVQKEARLFLYHWQTEWYWMGKRTKRASLGVRMGSGSSGPVKRVEIDDGVDSEWERGEDMGNVVSIQMRLSGVFTAHLSVNYATPYLQMLQINTKVVVRAVKSLQ